MKFFDVIIATPGNIFTNEYLYSLIKTIKFLDENKISWFWANAYNPHLGASRESVILNNKIGTEINYKKIFWIDSDISWEIKDFLKLLFSEKDIVCGAYILNPESVKEKYENFPISIMKDYVPNKKSEKEYRNNIKDIKNFEEFTEINESGFGFICVKKSVFDSLNGIYFCSININNFHIFSEDTSWCLRVRENGFKIFFDKSVLVKHKKNLLLSWSENE